jgi:hypothetical protein
MSCKTNESLNSTPTLKSDLDDNNEMYGARILKSGLDYNPEWHKTMKNREASAKEYWKKSFANCVPQAPKISDIDKENAKTIIVESYSIHSSLLVKWDTATSLQNIMSLCIDTAVLYVFPKGHDPWQLRLTNKENNWNLNGYVPMPVSYDQFYDLHYKKDLPFFNVDFVERSGYIWNFVVFIDDKGELMSIRFGVITPLKKVLKKLLKEYIL